MKPPSKKEAKFQPIQVNFKTAVFVFVTGVGWRYELLLPEESHGISCPVRHVDRLLLATGLI